MAKIMYVGLNMFSFKQDIFVREDDNSIKHLISVPLDKLGETICNYLTDEDIGTIEINGNEEYSNQLLYDLNYLLTTAYSERNVRVLLNGEVCFK